jgi:hypothetical protein
VSQVADRAIALSLLFIFARRSSWSRRQIILGHFRSKSASFAMLAAIFSASSRVWPCLPADTVKPVDDKIVAI